MISIVIRVTSALGLVFGSNIAAAVRVTPFELLDRYAANLKVIEMHHIKSEEICKHTDSLKSDKNRLLRLEYESIQNGRLRELTRKKSVVKINNEGSVISSETSQIDTVIWDGQEWSEVSSFPLHPSITPVAVFAKTDEDKLKHTSSFTYSGAWMDGIFWGDLEVLVSVLKKSSSIEVLPDMENINGFDCYVLEAVTPYGEYKLWIDPEHGYNIAKAETHKTDDDIYFGGVAYQVFGEMPPGRGYRGKRPGRRVAVHFYVDNVKFGEVNGTWLPVEATFRNTSDYDDRKSTDNRHHKRIYVSLKPDFKAIGAFMPDIPEGSGVFLEWEPDARHRWQNGKLITE